jgi:hypothetical protein
LPCIVRKNRSDPVLPPLKPGAKVIVSAQKAADGTLTATSVIVGKDGVTPPM